MSDEEVDELLKAVDTSSGEINYVGMYYRKTLCKWRRGRDGEGRKWLTEIDLVRTILAN